MYAAIKELKDKASVHELCEDERGYYRFFMDLDTKDEEEDTQNPKPKKDLIIETGKITDKLTTLMRDIFNVQLKLTFIQKSDKSQAYHVYGNFATTIEMMKQIVQCVDPSIDLKVYKRNTSLRMCNTFKTNQKDREVIKTFYKVSKEQYPHTVLNNIDDLRIIPENIGLINTPHIATYNITAKFGQDITDKLTTLLNVPFELKPADGYAGLSCVIKQPYKCPVTGNLHKSNNAYISKHYDSDNIANVMYKCHSSRCEGKTIVLGTEFDESRTM